MTKYWVFAANPKIYNIESAVNSVDVDNWTTKNSLIEKGDKVVIWKTLGKEKKRGILCLGEVLDNPTLQDDLNNPFWINQANGANKELRVPIRYITNSKLPIWVGEGYDEILLDLSVSKSQGGTVFKLTPTQWENIITIIGDYATIFL